MHFCLWRISCIYELSWTEAGLLKNCTFRPFQHFSHNCLILKLYYHTQLRFCVPLSLFKVPYVPPCWGQMRDWWYSGHFTHGAGVSCSLIGIHIYDNFLKSSFVMMCCHNRPSFSGR